MRGAGEARGKVWPDEIQRLLRGTLLAIEGAGDDKPRHTAVSGENRRRSRVLVAFQRDVLLALRSSILTRLRVGAARGCLTALRSHVRAVYSPVSV